MFTQCKFIQMKKRLHCGLIACMRETLQMALAWGVCFRTEVCLTWFICSQSFLLLRSESASLCSKTFRSPWPWCGIHFDWPHKLCSNIQEGLGISPPTPNLPSVAGFHLLPACLWGMTVTTPLVFCMQQLLCYTQNWNDWKDPPKCKTVSYTVSLYILHIHIKELCGTVIGKAI